MKFKSITLAFLLLISFSSYAVDPISKDSANKAVVNPRYFEIKARINEILFTKKEKLTVHEKEALKNELKGYKKELKAMKRESDNTLFIYMGIILLVFLVTIILI